MGELLAAVLGVSTVFAPTTTKDVVVRVGEYENKPGKRIYVESDYELPGDVPVRKDDQGYYVSEWDMNKKLASRIYDYLNKYGIDTDLQIARSKSEDLNAAGRIARAKKPTVYLSVHHNYFKDDSTGYVYFVNPEDEKSHSYAELLTDALVDNPGQLPAWKVREQDNYIGELMEKPGSVNVLLEAGFFSNKDELKTICSDDQIDYMAKETAQVLISILNNEQ